MDFNNVIEKAAMATGIAVVGVLVVLLFITMLPYLTLALVVAAAVGLGALALFVVFAVLALLWEVAVQAGTFITDRFTDDDS